jgi:hypothetical protein
MQEDDVALARGSMLIGAAMCVALLIGAVPGTAATTSDGRSYEMVSPADKNGGDVTADRVSITASTDGNAVAYLSRGSFGDTVGSGNIGQTQYVARRGTQGWTNHSVTPTPRYDAEQTFSVGTNIFGFSDDLRRAAVWAYDLPGVVAALPQAPNIYAEDLGTRALQVVSMPSVPVERMSFIFDFLFPDFGGVSHDSLHIAFQAFTPLVSDAPAGVPSVYRWDDGTLRLASRLADGTPAIAGATIAVRNYRESVSPDGSRVMFVSPPGPSGQLYMRIDDARTVWVSEPESGSPLPEGVVLQQVTGDSRHVIFATTSRLTDDDPNDGSDLYLYTDSADPTQNANLTLVTDTGDVPGVDPFAGTAVIGSSDDGRRIYYYKNGHVLLWDAGTTTAVADDVTSIDSAGLRLAATASVPGAARVSPDGRYLAFMARPTPTRNGLPVAIANVHDEMYLYDAKADSLRCVSCARNRPSTTDAGIVPNVTRILPGLSTFGLRPCFLADDGRTFFSTAEVLVPQDVNGVTDAYEFDPATGEVVLLSTGKGSEPAAFAAASDSGNDAFIVTRQSLVRADRDALVDVYDARVGGGFPEHDPLPLCEGDTCQGALTLAPDEGVPGSLRIDEDRPAQRRVRIVRRSVKGVQAELRIVLPAAGTIAWRGNGIRPGARQFLTAGTHTIKVALSARARHTLGSGRHRVVRVTARLLFKPLHGYSSRAFTSLAFTRSSSKKGR